MNEKRCSVLADVSSRLWYALTREDKTLIDAAIRSALSNIPKQDVKRRWQRICSAEYSRNEHLYNAKVAVNAAGYSAYIGDERNAQENLATAVVHAARYAGVDV